VKSQIYNIIGSLTWFENIPELVQIIHVPISDRKVAVIGANYKYTVLTENGTMCTSNGLQAGDPTSYLNFAPTQVKIDQYRIHDPCKRRCQLNSVCYAASGNDNVESWVGL
jgi:hypothetical protein